MTTFHAPQSPRDFASQSLTAIDDAFEVARHYASVAIRSDLRDDNPPHSLLSKTTSAIDKGLWMIPDHRASVSKPRSEDEFASFLGGGCLYDETQEPYYTQGKTSDQLSGKLSAIMRDRMR